MMSSERISDVYKIDCGRDFVMPEVRDTYGDSVGARTVDEARNMLLYSLTKQEPWVPLFAYRLCAPGQVAQALFCAADWHAQGSEEYTVWLEVAELFYRAVSSCIHLDYDRKFILDQERVHAILYKGEDPSYDFLQYDSTWPDFIRRCVPLLPRCFPAWGLTAGDSCIHCCDPTYENEDCQMIDRQSCCNGLVTIKVAENVSPAIEDLTVMLSAEALAFKQAADQCQALGNLSSEQKPPPSSHDSVHQWLSHDSHESQKVFPASDLFIAKNVCVDPKTGNWWQQVDHPARPLGEADTLAVAATHGGICGSGVPVENEVSGTAIDGRMICPHVKQSGTFTFDIFPVSIFPERQGDVTDATFVTGVTLLGGQLHSNIWHFMQDALFLKKAQDILGDRDILFSKYADSICFTDGSRCFTNKEIPTKPWGVWQRSLYDALGLGNFTFSKALETVTCYEAVAQPWRHLPGGDDFYERVLDSVRRFCNHDHEFSDQRVLVILDRSSKFRRWHNQTLRDLQTTLSAWALGSGWKVKVVRLAKLSFCDQVRIMEQADIVLGVGGADMANALFMRPGKALIEVEAFCHINRVAAEKMTPAKLCRSSQTGIVNSRCPPDADASTWRGPGLEFKGEVHSWVQKKFNSLVDEGKCPAFPRDSAVHQRYASAGYRSDLARSKGLIYTAITMCECVETPGSEQDCSHPFKQGDIKVDLSDVLPLIDILARTL